MTWFERVKACETPVELAELLGYNQEILFCPRLSAGFSACGGCHACIAGWLKEDAGCKSGS